MAIPKFESLANTALDILAGKLNPKVDWDTTNPQDLAIVLAQCVYQQTLHKEVFQSIRTTNKAYDVLRKHICLWLSNIQRYTKNKHDVSPMASAIVEYLVMHSMDVFDRAYPSKKLNPGFGFQQGIQDFVRTQNDAWRVAYLQSRQLTYSSAFNSELNGMLLSYPKQWNQQFENDYRAAILPKLQIQPLLSSVEDMTIFEDMPIWLDGKLQQSVWEHNIIKTEIENVDAIGNIPNNALSMWYVANGFLYMNNDTLASLNYRLDYRIPKRVEEGLAFFELHIQIMDDPYDTQTQFSDDQVLYAQTLAAAVGQYIVKRIRKWHSHEITRGKYEFAKTNIQYTIETEKHGLSMIMGDVIQSDIALTVEELNAKYKV